MKDFEAALVKQRGFFYKKKIARCLPGKQRSALLLGINSSQFQNVAPG